MLRSKQDVQEINLLPMTPSTKRGGEKHTESLTDTKGQQMKSAVARLMPIFRCRTLKVASAWRIASSSHRPCTTHPTNTSSSPATHQCQAVMHGLPAQHFNNDSLSGHFNAANGMACLHSPDTCDGQLRTRARLPHMPVKKTLSEPDMAVGPVERLKADVCGARPQNSVQIIASTSCMQTHAYLAK